MIIKNRMFQMLAMQRIAAALVILLVPAAFSQTHKPKPVAGARYAAKQATGQAAQPGGVSGSEIFTDVVIGPGQSVVLDSGIDYSDKDAVRISIQSAASDLAGLQLQAYWSVPMASLYNLTDVVDGSTFVCAYAGGAQFMVYGSQFRLVLVNSGSSTINLMQTMLFTHTAPPPPDDSSNAPIR